MPDNTALYREYSVHLASPISMIFRSENALLRLIDDRVRIEAVASGGTTLLKTHLVALGMKNAVAFGPIVSREFPILAIPALLDLPSLQFARAAPGAVRRNEQSLFPNIAVR